MDIIIAISFFSAAAATLAVVLIWLFRSVKWLANFRANFKKHAEEMMKDSEE